MTSVAHEEAVTQDQATRTITSVVLGEISITNDVVMHFPVPLWGFGEHREFALLPAAREGLWWLQSTNDAGLTFLLADPFMLDSEYGVDLGDTERAALAIESPSDALGLVMLTLPADGAESTTANFRAPLVFNVAGRRGMQVVSRDEGHELRRNVTLDVFPPQANGHRLL